MAGMRYTLASSLLHLKAMPEPVHLPADLQTWTVLGGPDCVVYRVCRLPYILPPALVTPTSPRNQMVGAKQQRELEEKCVALHFANACKAPSISHPSFSEKAICMRRANSLAKCNASGEIAI